MKQCPQRPRGLRVGAGGGVAAVSRVSSVGGEEPVSLNTATGRAPVLDKTVRRTVVQRSMR